MCLPRRVSVGAAACPKIYNLRPAVQWLSGRQSFRRSLGGTDPLLFGLCTIYVFEEVCQILGYQTGFESFRHERAALTLNFSDVCALNYIFLAVSLSQGYCPSGFRANKSKQTFVVLHFDGIAHEFRSDFAVWIEDIHEDFLFPGVLHGYKVRPKGITLATEAM